MNAKALILFAHGSRDPRWAQPLLALRSRLQAQGHEVELAFLELMTPDLASAAAKLIAAGACAIAIVPVFLGQGGHVREDLPRLVEDVRRQHPQVQLRLAPAVGEDDGVLDAIAAYCARNA